MPFLDSVDFIRYNRDLERQPTDPVLTAFVLHRYDDSARFMREADSGLGFVYVLCS